MMFLVSLSVGGRPSPGGRYESTDGILYQVDPPLGKKYSAFNPNHALGPLKSLLES